MDQDPGLMFWKTTIKLSGWKPAAGSLVVIALGLYLITGRILSLDQQAALRVVEIIIPLIMGWQAALTLSPEFERPIELLLTYPRSLSRILQDRLAIIFGLAAGAALLGNLATLSLVGMETLPLAVLRWLSSGIFLAGAGVLATQLSREGAFGTILVTLLWGGMLFGGEAMRSRWPFLWPLHVFMQPQAETLQTYLLNRAFLILAGMLLILTGSSLTRSEERMLGITRGRP